ncbi:DNA glycosylase [Phanerochaete sordida]|uniref:DNA glycosylase n=1 Tax=Phanerochaete sordida TaxID=48140 RepID=A0A9P3G0A3_9APHY|nr:DNA glycosylase [Phanerochaete sordida]
MPRAKAPKRKRSPTPERATSSAAANQAKKLKLLEAHSIESPFPDFNRPTPEEAQEVYDVLAREHPNLAPAGPSAENDAAGTCGKVPNVLESLIGTILSQNTSSKNSTAAKRNLDAKFGRNNFAAIARAPRADVVDALRTGGLANKKAEVIQRVLADVHARHGSYSLQHLAGAGADAPPAADADAMRELVSYGGVGPKTASCVLLFCLGRASFPVDTHVFRLARLLGWVPARADRVAAQAHLDLRVPDALKYGLHVLMVGHGRRCAGCRGRGDCPLKDWMKTRKGLEEGQLEAMSVKAEEDAEETKDEVNVES